MMPGRVRGPHPPQPLMAPAPAALETLWGERLSAGGSSPDICQGAPNHRNPDTVAKALGIAHAAQQPRVHSLDGRPVLPPRSLG